MSSDVAAELAALRDRLALDDLITAYARALDDRDWVRLAALFTDDANFDFTGAYGIAAPRDEFVSWMAGQVTREFAPHVQHHMTNRCWTIGDGTAEGDIDCFNPDVLDDGNGGLMVLFNGARYTCTAVRTADGWRLSRLVGKVLWSHRGELAIFELPES